MSIKKDLEFLQYVEWNWMNYSMASDFLDHYAQKYPEPPENPYHADLKMILESLLDGERYSLEVKRSELEKLRKAMRWSKLLRKYVVKPNDK